MQPSSLPSLRRTPGGRGLGLGLVVLLHVALVYALVTGLAQRAVDVMRAPISTKIVAPAAPPPKAEPSPPPPVLAPPPPPVVPPPEIRIAPQPPSTAIAPMNADRPATPNAITVAPAPPPAPVEILPRLDPGHSREPEYPLASRRLGEQGSVVLQALVDSDGKVLDTKLVQSSGFDRLDQAALAGVKQNYRFLPGTVDGAPRQMWFTFKFTWKLR